MALDKQLKVEENLKPNHPAQGRARFNYQHLSYSLSHQRASKKYKQQRSKEVHSTQVSSSLLYQHHNFAFL